MILGFLWLSSLCKTVSRSKHISANDLDFSSGSLRAGLSLEDFISARIAWLKSVSLPCFLISSHCAQGFRSVQSLSRVRLFATPWTTALQASLSITNSRSLSKLMSIDSVMPSNHLILCCPLLLPPSVFLSIPGSFPVSQFFASGGPRIGVSASASVLPVNNQDWFPLGLTGWIALQSQESSPTAQFKRINSSALSFLYSPTLNIHTWQLEKP